MADPPAWGGLEEGARGRDEYPPPPSPAGASFRVQVDALGEQSELDPGGHLKAIQSIEVAHVCFPQLPLSPPGEDGVPCAPAHSASFSSVIHFERIVDSRFFHFPNFCSLLQPLRSGFCLQH